ncbi:uncharacterized protein [Periplaneta americana]|uniref:uncharacterized protein n=1 Tax=Periplaneta americana TaxID=6978 RepID=UPI0037E9ACE0
MFATPRYQMHRLEILALEAVGHFVFSFSYQLLETLETKTLETAKMRLKNVRDMFHHTIPPRLVNEITEKLLSCINSLCYLIKEKFHDETMEDVISVVTHPALSRLDCTLYCHGMVSLLYRRLCVLNKIKVLKLRVMDSEGEQLITAGIKVMSELEEFSFECNCTDDILIEITKSCKRLRCLDVKGSVRVSDTSVTALKQLRHLECLNVFGTSISHSGYKELINGLADHLKAFGCSGITDILLRALTDLEALTIGGEGYSMGVFAQFRKLQRVSLFCACFGDVMALLTAVGEQLIHLELHNCKGIDIKLIAESCPAIQNFGIFSCSYAASTHQTLRARGSGFQKLKHLTIDKSSKYPACMNVDHLVLLYVLSQSPAVKTISIESYADLDEDFVLSLLQTSGLAELEELCVHAVRTTVLPLQGLRLIVARCANLSVVNVSGSASQGKDVEVFLREIKYAFPGIRVSVEMSPTNTF